MMECNHYPQCVSLKAISTYITTTFISSLSVPLTYINRPSEAWGSHPLAQNLQDIVFPKP